MSTTLILDLIDTAAIRAAVGVSEDQDELPDRYFNDLGMASILSLELSSWLPSTTSVSAIVAAGEVAAEGTDAWKAYEGLKNAAKFYCAWVVLQNRDISLFQRLEDGNNRIIRPTAQLNKLLESMLAFYNRYKEIVLTSLSSPTTLSTTWFMGSASPTFDPVTNTSS
jgi:hypothetical protein